MIEATVLTFGNDNSFRFSDLKLSESKMSGVVCVSAVCRIYSEQRAVRVKRVVDKKKM